MTRILTTLLIVVLVIPLAGVSDSAAAEGKRFKPRGRCVTVSNGRHRVRINCGRPKTNIEFGRLDFGVTIAEGVETATSRGRPRSTSTSESRSTTAPRERTGQERTSQDCHSAYEGCLPIVDDLNCEDIGFAEIRLVDPTNDPYGLDDRGVGNGITCDGEA